MITTPTRSHLQALTNLSRLPEWTEVQKLLQAELDRTLERLLDSSDDAETRKLQGRAKLLREFNTLVATAPDQLAKLRLS